MEEELRVHLGGNAAFEKYCKKKDMRKKKEGFQTAKNADLPMFHCSGLDLQLADPSPFVKAGVSRSQVRIVLAYDISMSPYYANSILLNGVHVFFVNGRQNCIAYDEHCKLITNNKATIRANVLNILSCIAALFHVKCYMAGKYWWAGNT